MNSSLKNHNEIESEYYLFFYFVVVLSYYCCMMIVNVASVVYIHYYNIVFKILEDGT